MPVEDRTLVRTGLIGAVVAAICCATPLLVLALGALGVGGAALWLDWLLIPALFGFVALAGLGLYRQRRATTGSTDRP